MSLPLENLLTPDFVRRVAWSPPEPLSAESIDRALEELGARPWQRAATAQLIADIFVDPPQEASASAETDS